MRKTTQTICNCKNKQPIELTECILQTHVNKEEPKLKYLIFALDEKNAQHLSLARKKNYKKNCVGSYSINFNRSAMIGAAWCNRHFCTHMISSAMEICRSWCSMSDFGQFTVRRWHSVEEMVSRKFLSRFYFRWFVHSMFKQIVGFQLLIHLLFIQLTRKGAMKSSCCIEWHEKRSIQMFNSPSVVAFWCWLIAQLREHNSVESVTTAMAVSADRQWWQ